METCELHEKELGAFCSVCWDAVCIDCITGEHRGHAIESIDDLVLKQKVRVKIYNTLTLSCHLMNLQFFVLLFKS